MNITINAPGAPPIELATRHDRTVTLSWAVGNNVPLVMDETLCRLLCDHLNDLADHLQEGDEICY